MNIDDLGNEESKCNICGNYVFNHKFLIENRVKTCYSCLNKLYKELKGMRREYGFSF